MPLPFILAGAAVIAGGYGVKKGLDAKEDFDTAERVNKRARNLHSEAKSDLESARDDAQRAMNDLGEKKFSAYEDQLIPFVETFKKIKNIDFDDNNIKVEASKLSISKDELKSIQNSALAMKEVVGGGVAALGSGGLAGLAAYGGVGMLGTASTGTAIGTLSGVAATNATLAWLGGGSLAAGGFGMAGGTAVLGGIVAGPVLAVGGMMLASKAETAKEDAYSNLSEAETAAEEMKTAQVATKGIQRRFLELNQVITELMSKFSPLLSNLQDLVRHSTNYGSYSPEDKKGVFNCFQLAVTLKNLLEAPVMNESGELVRETKTLVNLTEQKLIKYENTGKMPIV